MSAALGQYDEHYCFVCEEPLIIGNERLEFAMRVTDLHCTLCGRLYEFEFPITGPGAARLRMVGFGGEWD